MDTGIVTMPEVWLYDEKRSSVIDELFIGWAVGILGEDDGWYKIITHYGYEGYLRKDGICITTEEKLKRRDESGQIVFINRRFADIMERSGVHSRVLTTLSRGSFVCILPELENGYRRIRLANGQEGYLPCVAYECRKDNDGYLYQKMPKDFFLRQQVCMYSEKCFRERLVTYAKGYLGTQYRWAGKSAEGLDCSGLTFMCYLMSGILIYRDAKIKKGFPVHEISMDKIKPGDLLYFPGHIAMYIGNCRYIHATGNENSLGCVINSLSKKHLDYRKDLAENLLMVGSIF